MTGSLVSSVSLFTKDPSPSVAESTIGERTTLPLAPHLPLPYPLAPHDEDLITGAMLTTIH